jgi:hypothetical protein
MTKQQYSTAFPGLNEVRMRTGIFCPCGHELKASDTLVDKTGVAVICGGCNQDVLTVGRPQQ